MFQLTYALLLLVGAALGVGGDRLLQPTPCAEYLEQRSAELAVDGFVLGQQQADATALLFLFIAPERAEARAFVFESDSSFVPQARAAGWDEQGECLLPDGRDATILSKSIQASPAAERAAN